MARPRVRVRPSQRAQPDRPVTSSLVDADGWEVALRLADGDPRRLVILSPTEILVERTPRHR